MKLFTTVYITAVALFLICNDLDVADAGHKKGGKMMKAMMPASYSTPDCETETTTETPGCGCGDEITTEPSDCKNDTTPDCGCGDGMTTGSPSDMTCSLSTACKECFSNLFKIYFRLIIQFLGGKELNDDKKTGAIQSFQFMFGLFIQFVGGKELNDNQKAGAIQSFQFMFGLIIQFLVGKELNDDQKAGVIKSFQFLFGFEYELVIEFMKKFLIAISTKGKLDFSKIGGTAFSQKIVDDMSKNGGFNLPQKAIKKFMKKFLIAISTKGKFESFTKGGIANPGEITSAAKPASAV